MWGAAHGQTVNEPSSNLSPRSTSTDHLANLVVVRPRSDDFVGSLDGGRARPAVSTGCLDRLELLSTETKLLKQTTRGTSQNERK